MDLFRKFATCISLPGLLALSLGTAVAASDEELIAEAESAGPPGVVKRHDYGPQRGRQHADANRLPNRRT